MTTPANPASKKRKAGVAESDAVSPQAEKRNKPSPEAEQDPSVEDDERDEEDKVDGEDEDDEAEQDNDNQSGNDVAQTSTSLPTLMHALPARPPPLPDEEAPPLPDEEVPQSNAKSPAQLEKDDGWQPVWDDTQQAYYFYNRLTQKTQWENPRVGNGGKAYAGSSSVKLHPAVAGGYNPALHGSYDPNADYAIAAANAAVDDDDDEEVMPIPEGGAKVNNDYGTAAQFNRFTGKFQHYTVTSGQHNQQARDVRQMESYFDVHGALNGHDGKSLRAERASRKLTKKELAAFQKKNKEKKAERRRAWLRD